MGFFDEQFRAVGKAGRAVFLGGVAGENGFFQAGKPLLEQTEELHAIQHRHVDVHHRKLDGMGLEDGQRLIG